MSRDGDFTKLVFSNMQFEYVAGAVTPISYPHDTGRRIMPYSLSTQIIGDPVILELSDGTTNSFGHGEALIIPEGIPHKLTMTDGGRATSRWAHFRFTVFETVDALGFCHMPLLIRGKVAKEIGDLCQGMAEKFNCLETELDFMRMAAVKASGFRLVELIFQNSKFRSDFRETGEICQRLSPVIKYLKEVHPGKISLKQMAQKANLSVSRFSTLFHTATGESPVSYENRIRLFRARSLLLKTEDTIGEIAEKTSYKDQFHFSKAFKKEFGSSPKAYRSQNRIHFENPSF